MVLHYAYRVILPKINPKADEKAGNTPRGYPSLDLASKALSWSIPIRGKVKAGIPPNFSSAFGLFLVKKYSKVDDSIKIRAYVRI